MFQRTLKGEKRMQANAYVVKKTKTQAPIALKVAYALLSANHQENRKPFFRFA